MQKVNLPNTGCHNDKTDVSTHFVDQIFCFQILSNSYILQTNCTLFLLLVDLSTTYCKLIIVDKTHDYYFSLK